MRLKPCLALWCAALISCACQANVMAQSLSPPRVPAPDAALVVASQAGEQVTFGDIDEAVQAVPEERREHFIDSPKRIDVLISSLLMQKQLATQGRAAGLDKDPEVAAATGLAQLKLLALAQSAHFKNTIKVPDMQALARERYVAGKEKYFLPAALEVQDILITTGARSDAEAKSLAESIVVQAKADPARFDELVEKYSGDADKAKTKGLVRNAGDAMTHGEAFVQAASALNSPGDISMAFKTPDGFHVLKLVAKTPARQQTFDEIRESLLAQLGEEFTRKSIQDYVDGMRNQPMQADPQRVASLRTRYGAAPAPAATANAATGKP